MPQPAIINSVNQLNNTAMAALQVYGEQLNSQRQADTARYNTD